MNEHYMVKELRLYSRLVDARTKKSWRVMRLSCRQWICLHSRSKNISLITSKKL
jgi:hypothetical protein